jgi:hypothetical protein
MATPSRHVFELNSQVANVLNSELLGLGAVANSTVTPEARAFADGLIGRIVASDDVEVVFGSIPRDGVYGASFDDVIPVSVSFLLAPKKIEADLGDGGSFLWDRGRTPGALYQVGVYPPSIRG